MELKIDALEHQVSFKPNRVACQDEFAVSVRE
jgi:hypothetical protein